MLMELCFDSCMHSLSCFDKQDVVKRNEYYNITFFGEKKNQVITQYDMEKINAFRSGFLYQLFILI